MTLSAASRKPPRSVIVVGAGGHAKVVIATLRAAGWSVERAFDNREENIGRTMLGVPVDGPIAKLCRTPGVPAVIAVGVNLARRRISDELALDWQTVIHPSAYVDEAAVIETGAVVAAGAIVQPAARIGRHAIVNTGATVDHDCVLGAYSHAAPGVRLAGRVDVGEGALLGVGSIVIPGVTIGRDAIVGAGATVIQDVPRETTVVGTPAQPIQSCRVA